MRYQFMQDDSRRWYLMPAAEADSLDAAIESCESIESEGDREEARKEVWEIVSQFRCDGGPEHYTVTDPLERTAS